MNIWNGFVDMQMPIPKLKVDNLKKEAISLFKEKAIKRGRLTEEENDVEDAILMDNLHLIDDGYLMRAAMLAFYRDLEKWVTVSYIKIGCFGESDSDLKYQDEVHGALIEQVDNNVDLVYTKYMKALINYDGIQRTEQFMFHKDAFREILLNTIVHKDYYIMRQMLEAFSTFQYKKGIDKVSTDHNILECLLEPEYKSYFENLMYRLILNNGSHRLDQTKAMADLNFFTVISKGEKQCTAKEILSFIYLLNKRHLLSHLEGCGNVEDNL